MRIAMPLAAVLAVIWCGDLAEAPWSQPVKGLRWRAWSAEGQVEIGEPLVVHLEFHNVSGKPLRMLKELTDENGTSATWRTSDGRRSTFALLIREEGAITSGETTLLAPGARRRGTWVLGGDVTKSFSSGGTLLEMLHISPRNTNPAVGGFWTGRLAAQVRVVAVPARPETVARRVAASRRDLAALWQLLREHRQQHGRFPDRLHRFLEAQGRRELGVCRVTHMSYGGGEPAEPLVHSSNWPQGDRVVRLELDRAGKVTLATVRALPSAQTVAAWIDAVAVHWRTDPKWFRGKGDRHAIEVDFRDRVLAEIRRLAAVNYTTPITDTYPRLDYRRSNVTCFAAIDDLRSKRAVWCLATGLAHPNVDVRIRCAKALGEIGHPAAVRPLLAAARRNADLVPGSENATLHGIYQHSLADALNRLTRCKAPLRDGQDPQGLRKGIAAWERWLRENTAPPKPANGKQPAAAAPKVSGGPV